MSSDTFDFIDDDATANATVADCSRALGICRDVLLEAMKIAHTSDLAFACKAAAYLAEQTKRRLDWHREGGTA